MRLAIAFQSGPSDSMKPHILWPPCRRRSSVLPDRHADDQHRSRLRNRGAGRTPIAAAGRPSLTAVLPGTFVGKLFACKITQADCIV